MQLLKEISRRPLEILLLLATSIQISCGNFFKMQDEIDRERRESFRPQIMEQTEVERKYNLERYGFVTGPWYADVEFVINETERRIKFNQVVKDTLYYELVTRKDIYDRPIFDENGKLVQRWERFHRTNAYYEFIGQEILYEGPARDGLVYIETSRSDFGFDRSSASIKNGIARFRIDFYKTSTQKKIITLDRLTQWFGVYSEKDLLERRTLYQAPGLILIIPQNYISSSSLEDYLLTKRYERVKASDRQGLLNRYNFNKFYFDIVPLIKFESEVEKPRRKPR